MRALLLALLFAASALRAPAAALPGWETNHLAAVDKAKTNGEPALLYFTATWCGPCKLMARSTLTNATVTTALNGVIHAVIDIDEHQNFAAEHFVRAVPTFQVISPGGDIVDSITGFQEAAGFARWLTNSLQRARESVVRARELAEAIARADQLLAQPGAEARTQAAAVLFDLCRERHSAVQTAVSTRLKSLATTNPAALLPGLNHPALAARIQAANLLRERLGEPFHVDPWAPPSQRASELRAWQDKLSDPRAENDPAAAR